MKPQDDDTPEFHEFIAADYSELPPGVYAAPGTREEAQEFIDQIRKDFDLIDDSQMLRDLIDKMEERHGETFNTFFEVIIARFLDASGLKEITLNTENLFNDLTAGRGVIITAGPGTLTYRLGEKADD